MGSGRGNYSENFAETVNVYECVAISFRNENLLNTINFSIRHVCSLFSFVRDAVSFFPSFLSLGVLESFAGPQKFIFCAYGRFFLIMLVNGFSVSVCGRFYNTSIPLSTGLIGRFRLDC